MIEVYNFAQIDPLLRTIDQRATEAINSGQKLYVQFGTDKPTRKMTSKQRSALHVWCDLFAKALNDAGQYRKKVLFSTGEVVEVDWTKESFKEDVYKVVLEALSGKDSTEKQDSVEPSAVADHVNRHIGQAKGVTVGWPSLR